MKTTQIAFAVAAALAAATFHSFAQSQSNPRIVYAHTNSVKATVESIDYDTRQITLRTPEGTSARFSVSDEVKNFGKVKKGDQIRLGYYESVVLALNKPGEKMAATGHREAILSGSSASKPSGTAVSVTDMTVTIEAIDKPNREVAIKGPNGNVAIVHVDPEIGDLSRIKVGDRVTITHTDALAVSVEKSEP
jgi:Cu/Ag efflux protein CusF